MLFKNNTSSIWHVNGLIGYILLAFFVDWISFIVMSILGVTLAFICSGALFNDLSYQHLWPIYSSYSGTMIYLIFFSMKKKVLQEKKELFNLQIKQLNNALEQRVKERTIELEKAISVKTEFLNNMSHEIRTPIHGFVGISEGLDLNWNYYSDREKHLFTKEIVKNAKRLSLLIGNLLDLSKFHEGKMILDFSTFNISDAILEIISEANDLYIKDSGIKIKFIKKQEIFINADKERIAQLLRNLFINAIKFSPKNSKILVTLICSSKEIHFAIYDHGIGIPENEIEYIFNSFTQSTRTKTKAGGTGLGLSICQEIIKNHGGTIWATSNKNIGSTFHFTLPFFPKIKVSKALNPSDILANVLIIDDEPSSLYLMELILASTNCKLIKIPGAIEGLKILNENQENIDLIFLDLMIPDMHGLNVLKKIKQDPKTKHIPVIIQSGLSNNEEKQKCLKLGAASFITKPYNAKDIIAEISKIFYSKNKISPFTNNNNSKTSPLSS